jgi:hypothetical protein
VQPRQANGLLMSAEDVGTLARRIGRDVGKRANISPAELDALDFHARLIDTGASSAPTLLISFIDPNSANAHDGQWTGHVFALADSGANGYEATYAHAVHGDARTVEFQRLVNHLNLNGDTPDEIIVEAWKFGSTNDLVALAFKAGRWVEVLRVRQAWCLDPPNEQR